MKFIDVRTFAFFNVGIFNCGNLSVVIISLEQAHSVESYHVGPQNIFLFIGTLK
jgi:hypothetical protein